MIASVKTPYVPSGIVASPDGKRVYVVSPEPLSSNCVGSSVVSTINTATNLVMATLDTPDYDGGISISPDGKTLYLPATSTECGVGFLEVVYIDLIDTSSNSLSGTLGFSLYQGAVGQNEVADNAVISPSNAKLYSNHSYSSIIPDHPWIDEVAIFNLVTGAETTISDVLTVQVFSPDSQHLYGVGLGGVGVIDTAAEVSTTAVANIPGASGLAITPDGKHLYITAGNANSVLVADTETYTISTVIPIVGSGAIAISSPY